MIRTSSIPKIRCERKWTKEAKRFTEASEISGGVEEQNAWQNKGLWKSCYCTFIQPTTVVDLNFFRDSVGALFPGSTEERAIGDKRKARRNANVTDFLLSRSRTRFGKVASPEGKNVLVSHKNQSTVIFNSRS